MKRKLIINADDLGQTGAITDGILAAARAGAITSATLMVNGDAVEAALRAAAETPGFGVGIHLNIARGRPIAASADVPDLLDRESNLCITPGKGLVRSTLSGRFIRQVEAEWAAQIDRAIDLGLTPTHLDSHKHVHATPALFETAAGLAERFNIGAMRLVAESPGRGPLARTCPPLSRPARTKQWIAGQAVTLLFARSQRRTLRRRGLRSADRLLGIAETGGVCAAVLDWLVRRLPTGVTELMVHPGGAEAAGEGERISKARACELAALLDPAWRDTARRRGIELIHYGQT